MNILLAGGAGFLGSHFCDLLLENGHSVYCIDNLITGKKENIKHLFNNKNFKDILELLMPAFLSSTIGQIGIYVDIFFASGLAEGEWTAYGYANRIFQFPVGILVTAFLVPLFPLFSKLAGTIFLLFNT